jgi:hypothetical protein
VGNEENEYPVPYSNKTMIKELSDAHKKSVKEEIMEDITDKLMEKLQNMVNQKEQDALKKFQDITHKKT